MTTADQLNSMTYQELRDWWAVEHGYKYVEGREHVTVPHWIDSTGEPVWNAECRLAIHPLEDTLEAIAALLPEGWTFLLNHNKTTNPWFCEAVCIWGPSPLTRITCEATDEKRCRLLLACLVLLAERSGS